MRRRRDRSAGHAAVPGQEPWLPHRDTTVLLLSSSTQLQGEVGRVAAAAAVELVILAGLETMALPQGDIAAVLVDGAPGAAPAGWHGPVIVVGFVEDSGLLWAQAARLEADRVAVLPESAHWLANYLACLQNPVSSAGVLGVVGGCGGSGASTLSMLVAAEAAARGTRTLLVDGDRWGGGLGTLVSAQAAPGLRWPELLQASGSINPGQLAAALPQVGPLALLSWDSDQVLERGDAPRDQFGWPRSTGYDAVSEVMRAAGGAYELVVVDLGRSPEALGSYASHCNGLLVVVPGRSRAVAAAGALGAALPAVPAAAVVRGPVAEGNDAAMVAAAAKLPLVGELPWLRGVEAAMAAQRLPELLGRRPVRVLLAAVLGWMAGDNGAVRRIRAGARP